MIKRVLGLSLFLYSGWCFAVNNVNLEISSIDLPNDLTQVPPFLNFESTEILEVPVASNDIQNLLAGVNTQIVGNLQRQYSNLRVMSVESGIINDVTHPEIESHNYLANNNIPFSADYVLYGQLSNFNSFVTKNQVDSDGQSSLIYHLNLAIHYQLIRVSDKKTIADFIGLGNVGSATIKSILPLPNSQLFLPSMASSLYDSVYAGFARVVANHGITQLTESVVN